MPDRLTMYPAGEVESAVLRVGFETASVRRNRVAPDLFQKEAQIHAPSRP
jgi:hypothetical protein